MQNTVMQPSCKFIVGETVVTNFHESESDLVRTVTDISKYKYSQTGWCVHSYCALSKSKNLSIDSAWYTQIIEYNSDISNFSIDDFM
jgi:hypothetical protein